MNKANIQIAIERVLGSGMPIPTQSEIFTEEQKAKNSEAIIAALEAYDKQKQ